MGFFVYYPIFAVVAFVLGLMLYKLWDRTGTDKATATILTPEWLAVAERPTLEASQASAQELYNFSLAYIGTLKGACAAPVPAKLRRLGEVLASPHNLHDQLWQDMAMRLGQVYDSYSTEYTAIVRAVIAHSSDPIQHYAAYRLATGFSHLPRSLAPLADTLGQSELYRRAASARVT